MALTTDRGQPLVISGMGLWGLGDGLHSRKGGLEGAF